jgi:hypothetical protein
MKGETGANYKAPVFELEQQLSPDWQEGGLANDRKNGAN